MNFDLTVIDRQVYSILELLGDVGGLGEALVYIFTFILAFVNFGKFDTMMHRFLFLASIKSGESKDGENRDIGQTAIERSNSQTSLRFVQTNTVEDKSIVRSPALE